MKNKTAADSDPRLDAYKYPHKCAVRPFKIAGNLYYVGNASVSAHLVDTGEGLILLDTTYPHTYPLLINSIWELGFSIYDIKYILHSHGHFDHFGGTGELAALTGAKTFLGSGDARMFRERPELALLSEYPFPYLELFVPDVEIEDGQVISLGNTEIQCVSTPGHSPGVVSYVINVADGDAVYAAAMHGGVGFNTLNIRFLRDYGLDAAETRKDFLDGLKRLAAVKVDITLGNHPNQNETLEKRRNALDNSGGPNPFIDPGEWKRFLSGLESGLNKLIAEEAMAGK